MNPKFEAQVQKKKFSKNYFSEIKIFLKPLLSTIFVVFDLF